MKKQTIVERILDLSSRALSEKDKERFISYLKERSNLLAQIADKGVEVDEAVLRAWLEKEQEVLARLEEERKDALKEMDGLQKESCCASVLPEIPVSTDAGVFP